MCSCRRNTVRNLRRTFAYSSISSEDNIDDCTFCRKPKTHMSPDISDTSTYKPHKVLSNAQTSTSTTTNSLTSCHHLVREHANLSLNKSICLWIFRMSSFLLNFYSKQIVLLRKRNTE